jgi:hypothetical protein
VFADGLTATTFDAHTSTLLKLRRSHRSQVPKEVANQLEVRCQRVGWLNA